MVSSGLPLVHPPPAYPMPCRSIGQCPHIKYIEQDGLSPSVTPRVCYKVPAHGTGNRSRRVTPHFQIPGPAMLLRAATPGINFPEFRSRYLPLESGAASP